MEQSGYTYASNDLTNTYARNSKAGNGICRKSKKTREITSTELFFGGFQPFETTVRRAMPPLRGATVEYRTE